MAAFAARGLCADLLRLVLSEHDLVISEVVAEEVRRVPRDKIRASSEAMASLEAVLQQCERAPRSAAASPVRVGDPDDERVLSDAIVAGREFLVTGNDDPLSIAGDSPIPILSPRAFMMLARGGAP